MGRVHHAHQKLTDSLTRGLIVRLPRPLAERIPLLLVLLLVGGGIGGWIYRAVIRSDKQAVYHYNQKLSVQSPDFYRSATLLGFPMVEGNSAEILNNGDASFTAMIQDIQRSRRTINFENFIFRSDPAGEMFIQALSAAARRGVEVRLLIDAIGSKLHHRDRKRLREAGVHLYVYRPLKTFRLHKVSQRTHRKLMVVDGQIAYTGGAGIGKEWLGDARTQKEWRDTQVRVRGPVVAQMQAVFAENWIYTTGEILVGDSFYPRLRPVGNVPAQAMRTSRGDASSVAKMIYFVAIESARKRIYISNPYFVPDGQMIRALIDASRRGVDVQLLLPGKNNDARMIRAASWFQYGPLLKAGIRIYEYAPTMMHSKNFVVDGLYATVGSINFDVRSMSINAENGVAFYSVDFGNQMEALFRKDKMRCEEITLESWRKRSFFRRPMELVARLWEPYY
jgi:cardiolipin synthase